MFNHKEPPTRLIFLDPLEKHHSHSLLRQKLSEKTILCLGDEDHSIKLLKTFHLTPIPNNFLITDIKFYKRRKLLLVGHSMGIDGYDLENGEQSFHLEMENAVIRMCLVENQEEDDVIFVTSHHEFGYNVLKFILSDEIERIESDLGLLNAKCELTYCKDKNELYILDVSDGKILVLDGLTMQLKSEIENEFTRRAVSLQLNEYTNELLILTGNKVRIYDYTHNHTEDGVNTLVKLYGNNYSTHQEMMIIDDSVNDLSGMIFNMNIPYFNFLIGKKGKLYIIDGSSPNISKPILGYLNPPSQFISYYYDKISKKLYSFDQIQVYQIELKLEVNAIEIPLSEKVCNLVEKLEGQLAKIYKHHNSIPPSLSYFNSIYWKKPIWFRIEDMSQFDSQIEKDTSIAPIQIRKWVPNSVQRYFKFDSSNTIKIWSLVSKNVIQDSLIIGSGSSSLSRMAIIARSSQATSTDFPIYFYIDRDLYKCNISTFLSHLEKKTIIVMSYSYRQVFLRFNFEKMYSNLLLNNLINENTLKLDKEELEKAYASLIADDLLGLVSKHLR